ncbi:MAG: di-heme enzyme [Leptospiraceae bacterium]|nr:di-heme enzyme [Leptospiraceae bacterium]
MHAYINRTKTIRQVALLVCVSIMAAFAHCNALEQIGLVESEEEAESDNLTLLALLAAGSGGGNNSPCPSYNWNVPFNFPAPSNPADNCMTDAKVDLGRHLFYDRRLSQNETMSCASCHLQDAAFTDKKAVAIGSTGEIHARNAQHLSNVGYMSRLNWANSNVDTLEKQSLTPLFAQSGPSTIIELGLSGDAYLTKLKSDPVYRQKFAQAFGSGDQEFNDGNIRKALASFQRTLISANSKYDQFQRGTGTLTAEELRGALLFNGEIAECFHCHGGFNFSDTSFHSGTVFTEFAYHNNGIYSAAEYAAKPQNQRGLVDVTGKAGDEGRFRAPSLRNVGVTFPYMHDGSFDCNPQDGAFKVTAGGDCGADPVADMLGHVLDHYSNGAALKADGSPRTVHPQVDVTLIRPFPLSAG